MPDTTFTLAPPVATPTTTGGDGAGPPLYWTGQDPKTGLPGAANDPSTLSNPVPVYRAQPGAKPTYGGGGQGRPPGVSFTLAPPAPTPAAPLPPTGGPPTDATGMAPPTFDGAIAGLVPPPQAMPQRPGSVPELQQPQPPPQWPVQGSLAAGAPPPELRQPAPPVRPPGAPLLQPPQLAPPAPPPSWGHTIGLAGAKALEGVPLTAAMLGDVPLWALNTGLGMFGGSTGLPSGYFGQQVERGYQALGLPEPQSPNEQMLADTASAIGGTIGTMGLGTGLRAAGYAQKVADALTAMKGRQLLAAGGSGVGANLAQSAGLGPTGQLATAVLSGLAAHGAGTAGLTGIRAVQAARQAPAAIVGQQLARSAAQPAALAPRLATPPVSGLPGAPMTTAMVTRDPRLMMLEKALRETPQGHGIRGVEAARAGAIADALTRMRRAPGLGEGERGQVIRRALNDNERTLGRRTDQLYNAARAGTGTYNIAPMQSRLLAIGQKYYGPGSGGAPTAFTDIATQLRQRGATASNEFLINMDRQIGDAARMAGRAGDNTQAAALRAVQRELDAIHGSPDLQTAKTFRARVGSVMGHDATGTHATGDILKENQFGNPTLADDKVARRAVQSPAAVRQVLQASDQAIAATRASGAAPAEIARITAQKAAVRTVMREQFLDRAADAHLSGDVATYDRAGAPVSYNVMSPTKWDKFWQANQATAGQLFSPAEQTTLRQVTDMLADDAMVSRTAASQGSSTARNLTHLGLQNPTVGNVLTRITQGRVAPDSLTGRLMIHGIERVAPALAGFHVGGPVGAFIGHQVAPPILDAFIDHRDEAIRALLSDAMADPRIAKTLLAQGNAANIALAMQLSRQSGGKLWGLVRRLLPAGTATEAQSNQPPLPRAAGTTYR